MTKCCPQHWAEGPLLHPFKDTFWNKRAYLHVECCKVDTWIPESKCFLWFHYTGLTAGFLHADMPPIIHPRQGTLHHYEPTLPASSPFRRHNSMASLRQNLAFFIDGVVPLHQSTLHKLQKFKCLHRALTISKNVLVFNNTAMDHCPVPGKSNSWPCWARVLPHVATVYQAFLPPFQTLSSFVKTYTREGSLYLIPFFHITVQ